MQHARSTREDGPTCFLSSMISKTRDFLYLCERCEHVVRNEDNDKYIRGGDRSFLQDIVLTFVTVGPSD